MWLKLQDHQVDSFVLRAVCTKLLLAVLVVEVCSWIVLCAILSVIVLIRLYHLPPCVCILFFVFFIVKFTNPVARVTWCRYYQIKIRFPVSHHSEHLDLHGLDAELYRKSGWSSKLLFFFQLRCRPVVRNRGGQAPRSASPPSTRMTRSRYRSIWYPSIVGKILRSNLTPCLQNQPAKVFCTAKLPKSWGCGRLSVWGFGLNRRIRSVV